MELDLLRDKLRLTRLPKGLESAPWTESKDTGLTVPSLRTLHEFWLNEYSWRDEEKRLNQFPQFITTISLPRLGDLDLHFIHSPSAIDGSVPLLFLHGWPGSCFEVSHALPALNEAGFDVVAPSLLGFGFSSDYPNIGGVSFHDHATVNHHLMLRLGYKKYIVQGGDWGASVTRSLALLYPEHVQAIHVNYFTAHTPSNPPSDLTYTPFERKKLEQNKHWNEHETGYFFIQHQRPLALGIGLHDSPIGMLAWMADKLLSWSDAYSPSNPTGYHWSPTELITWTLLHYFPGPTRSFAIYAETDYEKDDGFKGPEFVNVPTGVSAFKEEKEVVPRKWAEAKANVVFWRDHPEGGGHFAMYERPAEMVADIRKFAEQLRMLKKGILP